MMTRSFEPAGAMASANCFATSALRTAILDACSLAVGNADFHSSSGGSSVYPFVDSSNAVASSFAVGFTLGDVLVLYGLLLGFITPEVAAVAYVERHSVEDWKDRIERCTSRLKQLVDLETALEMADIVKKLNSDSTLRKVTSASVLASF